MRLTSISESDERQLAALNAKADTVSMRDADAWDEAIDWGVPEYGALCPSEWSAMAAADCD
jgi:hypothetical protein